MTFDEFYKKTGNKTQSRGIGAKDADQFDLDAFIAMREAYYTALISDEPKSALEVIKDCEAQFKHPFHCNYFQANAEYNINKNNIKAERHALAALDAATKDIPDIYIARLFCVLGGIYVVQNNPAKTEAAYTQCASYSDDPEITEIANANLIDIYLKRGDWSKIVELSGALVESKDEFTRAFGNSAAGMATLKLFGDLDTVMAHLQAAYSLKPGDPNNSCILAFGYLYKTAILLQASNRDAAVESMFKVIDYYKQGLAADKSGTGACRKDVYEVIRTIKDHTKFADPQLTAREIYNFITNSL
jgi:tetratricopeptide (TPR) repeat protein